MNEKVNDNDSNTLIGHLIEEVNFIILFIKIDG